MKVLFIYTPNSKEKWIPIGLLYICGYLESKGIECKIVNSDFDNLNNNFNLFQLVINYKPDFIGLGGMSIASKKAIEFGNRIKIYFPKIKLIFGGVHFTFMQEQVFDIADIIIKGEAEKRIYEIINGSSLKDIKGIIYKEGREIIDNGDYELLNNIDDLPFPAYHQININDYDDQLITGEKAVSILTGRGCPYSCLFCSSPALWRRKVRLHSIDYIIEHIKFLVKNYDVKSLRIMDDTFTVNKNRVLQFCEAIQKNNIKLNMTCLTNVNNSDIALFKEMKKTGFSIVAFGIENVSRNIQKLIKKNLKVAKMKEAIKQAHEAGLKTELLFMVGNPGETKKTIKDNFDFVKEVKPFSAYFQLATPIVGSEFAKVYKKYGELKDFDSSEFDHKKLKFIPKGLDEETLKEAVKYGNSLTYNR